ncbi:hypothetical protein CLF_108814, partial [Clonorchis sinensis]
LLSTFSNEVTATEDQMTMEQLQHRLEKRLQKATRFTLSDDGKFVMLIQNGTIGVQRCNVAATYTGNWILMVQPCQEVQQGVFRRRTARNPITGHLIAVGDDAGELSGMSGKRKSLAVFLIKQQFTGTCGGVNSLSVTNTASAFSGHWLGSATDRTVARRTGPEIIGMCFDRLRITSSVVSRTSYDESKRLNIWNHGFRSYAIRTKTTQTIEWKRFWEHACVNF